MFLPWLLTTALVEWIGTGLFLSVSTLFFVRVAGLRPAQLGPGLALAGLVALSATLPIGKLADRYGPRNVLILLNLTRAAATACFILVHDWWSFLAASVPVAVTEQSAPPLIMALVGGLVRPDLRTRVMAVHRSVVNLGMSIGGLGAGLFLGNAAAHIFTLLFIADAVAFAGAATLLLRVEDRRVERVRGGPRRRGVLRDRRLLALTALDATMSLWQPILNVAFPLWLMTRTDAPVRLVGILYALATVTCIVLQYSISGLATTPRRALRSYSRAGLFMASACFGFAVAPEVHGTVTIAVLATSIVLLTLGELFQVGAAWTLSFAVAPAESRNVYLSVFGMGRTIGGRVAGPLVMTGAVLALGSTGWIALAFLLTAAAVVPVIVSSRAAPAAG